MLIMLPLPCPCMTRTWAPGNQLLGGQHAGEHARPHGEEHDGEWVPGGKAQVGAVGRRPGHERPEEVREGGAHGRGERRYRARAGATRSTTTGIPPDGASVTVRRTVRTV